MKPKQRCGWPGEDALYVAYHDQEWGVPEFDSRALYEKLVLDGFQAGLSWITILRKRENFRKAFHEFDPQRIARYGASDIDRLLKNDGIIRSRAKIEAAIKGARLWLEIEKEPGRLPRLHLEACRRQAHRQPPQDPRPDSGPKRNEPSPVARPETARVQILRPGDRLCLRPGRRHGQRSCRDLLPACGMRQAGPALSQTVPRPSSSGSGGGCVLLRPSMLLPRVEAPTRGH